MGSLKLTTASSGSVILSPANTASDVTITVPAVTGTMLTNKTAGTVLQVVQATYSTQVSSTSASWVTTGLTASITPSSSSNKILAIATVPARNNSGSNGVEFTIFRGTTSGTNLGSSSEGFGNFAATGDLYSPITMQYLDSPSTTSSQTYTVAIYVRSGTTGYAQNGNGPSVLTLMEIAA